MAVWSFSENSSKFGYGGVHSSLTVQKLLILQEFPKDLSRKCKESLRESFKSFFPMFLSQMANYPS